MALVGDQSRVRMITLTLSHGGDPLAIQIDRLYAAFRRLRQRDAWKTHVSAAAAACEVKLSADGKWHVHLHVLTLGEFWLQREISAEWLAVTGDSRIVDVRALPAGRAVNYAAKYIGKSVDANVETSIDRLVEAVKAMAGRRSLIVCGDWVGKLADDVEKDPAEIEKMLLKSKAWRPIGSLLGLHARADRGCVYSRKVLDEIDRKIRSPRDSHRPRPPDKHALGGGVVQKIP